MSSRRLLALLKHLPEKSFQLPDSDWPLSQHLAAGQWNETKAMRADLWAFLGNERLSYQPVLPPSAQRARDEEYAAARAGHDFIIAQLGG